MAWCLFKTWQRNSGSCWCRIWCLPRQQQRQQIFKKTFETISIRSEILGFFFGRIFVLWYSRYHWVYSELVQNQGAWQRRLKNELGKFGKVVDSQWYWLSHTHLIAELDVNVGNISNSGHRWRGVHRIFTGLLAISCQLESLSRTQLQNQNVHRLVAGNYTPELESSYLQIDCQSNG